MASKLSLFLAETKRRKVYHVAVVYIVVGFAVAQGAEYCFQLLDFPLAAARFVAILIIIGFPIALVLAWAYEVRPEEGKESEGQKKSPADHSVTGDKKSIAVLPFENLSSDLDQEYFCDGMTEELINALAHVKDLKVIARTSAFVFKGRHEDVREIGRKLGSEHLLEGSVRKDGNRLRITAQLIKTTDGSHLFSERWDRDLDDVFSIQEEISLAVVETLKLTLLQESRPALTKRHRENTELFNLYLLGRHHWNKLTPEGLAKSVEFYEKAIQKDPDYSLAHAGAAEVSLFLTFFVGYPPREVIPKAKAHVQRALELDPHLAEAYAFSGRISLFFDWDLVEADRSFERAVSLDPQAPFILSHYADFLSVTNRHDEAVEMMARARELDPLNSFLGANTGERLFFARRFEEAIEVLEETVSNDQDYYWTRCVLGMCLTTVSRFDEAIVELEIAHEASGREPMIGSYLASAYWRSGAKSSADDLLEEIEAKAEKEYVPASFLFCIYNTRGESDQAFKWFERALEERCFMVPFCLAIPDDPMRFPAEQRFNDRLREVGLVR